MREHLEVAAAAVVPVIEAYIARGNRLDVAVAILRDDLEAYSTALLECCPDAAGVRGAVALLGARRGDALDESALRSALTVRDRWYLLFAIDTLRTHRDTATVHRLLEPSLRDPDPEIVSAAKQAVSP
jgi:hypothetical protein